MIIKSYTGDGSEKQILIQVKDRGHGIMLSAVDQTGFVISHLLEIREDGQVYMCGSVNNRLGFKLDNQGCILIAEKMEYLVV